MEKLNITSFDIKKDLKEVKTWKNKYKNHPGYQQIREFILDDNEKFTLDKIIKAYYEPTPIGKNERNTLLSIKDSFDNLLGFVIANEYNLTTQQPELHIDFVVVNPEFQNHGVATFFLKEIISKPTSYLSTTPHTIYAIVSGENIASLTVFQKLGFNYTKLNSANFYRVSKEEPSLEEEKEF